MASYPTAKVHRPSRRKLGKGQFPAASGTTVTITDAGSVATLNFAKPVIVSGPIPLAVSGGPVFVSQVVNSPTQVTITYSAALAAKPYNLPSNAANIATYQGGGVSGLAGVFS